MGIQLITQHALNALAQVGREHVSWYKHQAGVELTADIGADKQAHLAAFTNIENTQRGAGQGFRADLEQIIAGVDFQHLQQLLAVVALGVEAGDIHHGLELAAQQRNIARRLVVYRGGEQAKETTLADHIAVIVVAVDGDVVWISGAMHAGVVRAFGEREQLRHQHVVVVLVDALFGADTLTVAWLI